MDEEFSDIDQKGVWTAVYHDITRSSGKYSFSYKDAKKIENNEFNRYRDVSPYDHSRIKLQRSNTDYINACLVKVSEANRAYILTQGPLSSTAGHFWLMIWEQNSKAILMLNRVVEKNVSKCYQYWPKSGEINSNNLVFNDVGLIVTFVDEMESSFVITKLLLTDIKSQESRTILHFHYTSWPDFGVPESPSVFLNFLQAVKDHHVLDINVGPAVIHCSAGIGRSGTFCLVDSCLVLCEKSNGCLKKGKIKQVLLDMRMYRMGLIQTPDQFRFSYLSILEGAKRFIKPRIVDNENNHMIENCKDIISTNNGVSENVEIMQPLLENSLIKSNTISNPIKNSLPHIKETISEDSVKLSDMLNSDNKECLELNSSNSNVVNNSITSQRTNYTISSSPKSPKNITSSNSSELQNSRLSETSSSENRLSITLDDSKDNIPSAESNRALRKRQRQERIDKTNKKICEMKEKQRSSEVWLKRRRFNSEEQL